MTNEQNITGIAEVPDGRHPGPGPGPSVRGQQGRSIAPLEPPAARRRTPVVRCIPSDDGSRHPGTHPSPARRVAHSPPAELLPEAPRAGRSVVARWASGRSVPHAASRLLPYKALADAPSSPQSGRCCFLDTAPGRPLVWRTVVVPRDWPQDWGVCSRRPVDKHLVGEASPVHTSGCRMDLPRRRAHESWADASLVDGPRRSRSSAP